MNSDGRIPEILAAFKYYDGIYKRNEIDAAIELKDQITPALIMILEDLLSNPHVYVEDGELYDHIYAVMLLGHFKKRSAHKLIVDIFSLPDELPHDIFGEIATSDLPTLLINTCGGNVNHIKNMILNPEVDDYCRISACQALAYAVVEDYVPRIEVVEFFGTLFTGQETDDVSDFWGLLAGVVCDLYPIEIMVTIKASYENGLIMPGIIGFKSFEIAINNGKIWCLEKLRDDLERRNLDDLHAAMSWWACFEDNKKTSIDVLQQRKNQKISKNKKASAKKKKRKQAKKSRKKNRR